MKLYDIMMLHSVFGGKIGGTEMKKFLLMLISVLLFSNFCSAQALLKPYYNQHFGFSMQIPAEFELIRPTQQNVIMSAAGLNNTSARASMNISALVLNPQEYGSLSEMQLLQYIENTNKMTFSSNPNIQLLQSTIASMPNAPKTQAPINAELYKAETIRYLVENKGYTYEEAEELMRPRYLAMVEREKAERLAQSTRNMDSTAQPSLVLLQHFITNSTDSNGPFALENMICVVKCGMNVYSICYSAVPSYFKAYNQNFLQSLMSFQNGTRMTMQPRSYSNPTNVYGNNRSSSSGGLG